MIQPPSERGSRAERGTDRRLEVALRHAQALSVRLTVITATHAEFWTPNDTHDLSETLHVLNQLATVMRSVIRPPRADNDHATPGPLL